MHSVQSMRRLRPEIQVLEHTQPFVLESGETLSNSFVAFEILFQHLKGLLADHLKYVFNLVTRIGKRLRAFHCESQEPAAFHFPPLSA